VKKFSSCVLKLTAVCNLDCKYCYMFNLADKTHLRVPAHLSIEAALRTLDRIAAHLDAVQDPEFRLVLHGGEPTLWPLANFEALLSRVEQLREGGLNLHVSMQTNAYKIEPKLLPLLSEHKVSVGISIDGPAISNDRFRTDHSGRGSYDRVMANTHAIITAGYQHLIGGFLTVAQPEMDPSIFLAWVAQLPVRRADVLWPIEFHHANPPWEAGNADCYAQSPRYGQWFAELFALWWQRDDPSIYIRLFYQIIERMLGSRVHGDGIVNDEAPLFVVNTDGGIEYPDYFRAYTDRGSRTAFNVFHNDLDELSNDAGFSYCLSLKDHLPKDCRSCPQVDICGGGFLPGRMMPGEWPPQRKSVLCADQLYFFSHVQSVIGPSVARRLQAESRSPLLGEESGTMAQPVA
jgi:uncharacterized protein